MSQYAMCQMCQTTSASASASASAAITIPECVLVVGWEASPAARKFRRPAQMIRYRALPAHDRVAEYELDDDDLAWLAEFNREATATRQPPSGQAASDWPSRAISLTSISQ